MFKFLVLTAAFWLGNLTLAFADGVALPAGTAAQGAAPVAGGPGAGAGQPPQSFLSMMFPFLAMFGVVYFLMIRPQQKKMREQQEMLSNLKHGDEILTSSGILGKVTGIADKVVTVELADNVRVKMLKSQVSQVVKGSIKDLSA